SVGAELGDLAAELPLRVGKEPAGLLPADGAVAVGVRGLHPSPRLPRREPQVEAPQRALQLLPADPAVVVRVELPQPRPELLRRHLSLRQPAVPHERHRSRASSALIVC
uniref:Uncharacterized protein n=1 Tax=Triticum urartu TaxID=4572 RepID=A0A8R7R1X3_TRIUA